jgi:hypothetical protein
MKQSARCTDRPPARRRAFRLLGLALVLLALTLTLPAGVLADPPTPPTISGFSPDRGRTGTTVILTGNGLRGATLVEVADVSAHFAVLANNRLKLVVPAGAVSGPISVTTLGGTAVSLSEFIMAPNIFGFSPAGGRPDTIVTVKGTNFSRATSVTFNGSPAASFAVLDANHITATVPAAATTGPIVVTTAAGSARSSAPFTVTANPAKALTAFSFQGTTPPATGVINEVTHAIAVTVPPGTDVHALVATFTTTGAAVAVARTPQVSGTTANDFSRPVTYRVTAADGTGQDYLVTVGIRVLAVGDAYGGGVVAYLLQNGDPGYDATVQHGLIAAEYDQDDGWGVPWALSRYASSFVLTSRALGTGAANTTKIIAQNGPGVAYAAGLARACTDGGYSDWYLPSKDELKKLYLNKDAIGGFVSVEWNMYWSSSQSDHPHFGVNTEFETGSQGASSKTARYSVRAVRSF